MMAQKPLMLKDYLELESGSESSSRSDFRWAPRRASTVRCLLEAEFHRGGDNDSGRRQNARGAVSKSAALRKLSAVINAVKLLHFSSSSSYSSGGGSGGFSKRLIRGGFWKSKKARLREEPEKIRVPDIVQLQSFDERGSFGFLSPVVSSCSETTASSCVWDFLPSSVSGSGNLDDMAAVVAIESENESSPPCTLKPAETVAGRHRPPPKQIEGEGMASPSAPECRMEDEEKEQLSPVSVMDFPYEQEDEEDEISDVASPSFNQAIANIERTKLQLLQKIRRFECLADLDAAHLEDLSTSGDEQDTASDYESDGLHETSPTAETRAWDLLEELRHGTRTLGSFEKLLLDFFVQALRRSDEEAVNLSRPRRLEGAGTSSGARQREDSMLRAARDWVRGDVEERSGEATIKKMESSGRWRCHAEEEDVLGADLDGHVFGLLLDELLVDLHQL